MALINPMEYDVLLEKVEEETPIGEHGEDVNPRHGAGNADRRLFDDSAPKAPLKEQSTVAYINSLEERINKKDEIILTIQEELLKLKTEVHGAKKTTEGPTTGDPDSARRLLSAEPGTVLMLRGKFRRDGRIWGVARTTHTKQKGSVKGRGT